MKIALISYEYPPDTAVGGVGTYVLQISKLLSLRGHHVEVFTGSPDREIQENYSGVIVNRVLVTERKSFPIAIIDVFRRRHQEVHFDVMESPEVGAEALHLIEAYPKIPLVVKLHTPSFMVSELNYVHPSIYSRVRRFVGALRRFERPKPFATQQYDARYDPEYQLALSADEVTTPSVALGEELVEEWTLDPNKVFAIPNPYVPNQRLLKIPTDTQTQVVTYLGRLERRKGVVELAKAIPYVLGNYPEVKFRFIGQDQPFSATMPSCQAYLENLLEGFMDSVEFTGKVSLDQIPDYLAQTDICVFPSLWENFPNVCLEAMAAGRGVVGSSAGGMVEMLDHGKAGILVPPDDFESIAIAIEQLLSNPALRISLGQKARARVISEYSLEHLGQLLEDSYQRAIRRRKSLGSRYVSTRKIYVKA